MRRKKKESSFLSVEKDIELILQKLFVENPVEAEMLKRLLVINVSDALDDYENPAYIEKIKSMSISNLFKEGYIRLSPKLELEENAEVKSYLLITFDNFSPSSNLEFRDCIIMIDVICNTDCWNLGNYRLRPFKICGIVDSILNEARLTGIGQLAFVGCNEIILNEELSGYCLTYQAYHGSDDYIEDYE